MQCLWCHCENRESLTVDDEGEVSIIERRVWDGNASLVETIVDPLSGSRGHIQDSLHRILWAAAHHVPVHHSLTVLQSVAGPHHAGAVAGQDGLWPCGEGDVLGLHHHTEPAAAALTPGWHEDVKKQTQTINAAMRVREASHASCYTSSLGKQINKHVSPPGSKSTARTETHTKNKSLKCILKHLNHTCCCITDISLFNNYDLLNIYNKTRIMLEWLESLSLTWIDPTVKDCCIGALQQMWVQWKDGLKYQRETEETRTIRLKKSKTLKQEGSTLKDNSRTEYTRC